MFTLTLILGLFSFLKSAGKRWRFWATIRETTTIWYYVNSRINEHSEKSERHTGLNPRPSVI